MTQEQIQTQLQSLDRLAAKVNTPKTAQAFLISAGIVTPIPAKGIDHRIFKQFQADLSLLLQWETQESLGKWMGIKKTNLNRYIRGYLPVTKGFLHKFYESCGKLINEKTSHLRPDHNSPATSTQEPTLVDVMIALRRIEQKVDQLAAKTTLTNA